MRFGLGVLGMSVVLTSTLVASAQEDEATQDDGTFADAEAQDAAPAEGAASDDGDGDGDGASSSEAGSDGDGGRFRFGIAGGAGPLTADGLDLTYYGLDMRFGWQINDAIAVYGQPQLGYYKLDGADATFGSGGLIGGSVVGEYTLFDRLFFGAGVGYAILNNPSGSELHFRAGGYPLMGRNDTTNRRKGLMVGIDLRLHFVEGLTFVAPTFNLGYESF